MSQDEKKKPTPEEKLARILAQAAADEAAERVAKMSDEAIAKELADAGVDLEAEERKMAALLAKHGVDVDAPAEKKEDEKKGAEVVAIGAAKAKSSNWIWYAVAAGIVAVVAWQWAKRGIEPDVPVAHPFDAGVEEAAAPRPSSSASAAPSGVAADAAADGARTR